MFLFWTALAYAGEHPIDPNALPTAVTTALQARYPGATVESATVEGRTFEAKVLWTDRHLDLAFQADGTWLEEEEHLSTAALPAALAAALQPRWADWTLGRVERATTPSGTTYEVVMQRADRSVEVRLTEGGEVLRVRRADD